MYRWAGQNAIRIYLPVAAIVMLADMGQIDRGGDARPLIDISQKSTERRVIDNPALLTFKMGHVDIIKTDQCGP